MSLVEDLQELLSCEFEDPDLAIRALNHASWAHENEGGDNERLEFLGDAVLQMGVTELLFQSFPEAPEGQLTRYRQQLVNTDALAGIALEIGLDSLVRLGRGAASSGATSSVLAGTVEALLGAVFIDRGYVPARAVVERWTKTRLGQLSADPEAWKDPRNRLQELTQSTLSITPDYHLMVEEGVSHAPIFEVEVRIEDRALARGRGPSKREASRRAALAALAVLSEE